jgi:hypothetical protein
MDLDSPEHPAVTHRATTRSHERPDFSCPTPTSTTLTQDGFPVSGHIGPGVTIVGIAVTGGLVLGRQITSRYGTTALG